MLAISNLYKLLTQYSIKQNGDMLCIYGDPAYPLRLQLQAPYMNALLTPQQKYFNMSLSKVRTSVEWPYDVIPHQLTFIFLVLSYFLFSV